MKKKNIIIIIIIIIFFYCEDSNCGSKLLQNKKKMSETGLVAASLTAAAAALVENVSTTQKDKAKREPVELFAEDDDYEEDTPLIKRPKKDFVLVLTKDEVETWRELGSEMKCEDLSGRKVMIFIKNGEFYCVDALCAHMGHPLMFADIEDGPTIRCAAHRWKFFATGERIDDDNKPIPGSTNSLRPHEVLIINDQLMVAINTDGCYSSDVYQQSGTEPETPDHTQLPSPPSTPGQSRTFHSSPGLRARRAMAARMCSFSSIGSQER